MTFDKKKEMTFLEFVDGLPPHMQKTAWDHFVLTLPGKPTPPLVIPLVTTVSANISIDDHVNHLADVLHLDPSCIDKSKFKAAMEAVKISKSEVTKLISHLLENEQNNKVIDEIISLGKFVYTTDLKAEIQKSERPDFVLTINEDNVGIEHTRVEDANTKELHSELLKKYVQNANKILRETTPLVTGIANLVLDFDAKIVDGFSLQNFKSASIRKQAAKIQSELAQYVRQKALGNNPITPQFVRSCSISPSEECMEIRLQDEYLERLDFEEKLKRQIENKNQKLTEYKLIRSDIKEWWLLLTIDGTSMSSGYRVRTDLIDGAIQTEFNRVFILNTFNLSCFELQKQCPYLLEVGRKAGPSLSIQRSG